MKYDFCIDRKVTVWVREHWQVEAKTKSLAEQMVINGLKETNENLFQIEGDTITFMEQENLFETQEEMTVEENGGNATMEAFFEPGEKSIYTNERKS